MRVKLSQGEILALILGPRMHANLDTLNADGWQKEFKILEKTMLTIAQP